MSKQTPDTDTTVAKESRLTDKQKKIAIFTGTAIAGLGILAILSRKFNVEVPNDASDVVVQAAEA